MARHYIVLRQLDAVPVAKGFACGDVAAEYLKATRGSVRICPGSLPKYEERLPTKLGRPREKAMPAGMMLVDNPRTFRRELLNGEGTVVAFVNAILIDHIKGWDHIVPSQWREPWGTYEAEAER